MNVGKMFTTIDTHVLGEAFRIILHSPIQLNEGDIQSNHKLLKDSFREEKALLLNEPRGYRGINGCIVLPSKVADFGLVFFNHDHDVSFQYGGLVATVTALLETGNLAKTENDRYTIESVYGVQEVSASFTNQEVTNVYVESNECSVVGIRETYHLVEVDKRSNYLISSLPESIPSISLDYLSAINKWGREMSKQYFTEITNLRGIILVDGLVAGNHEVQSITFNRDGTILRTPGFESTFAILTAMRLTSQQKNKLTNYSIFDSSLTIENLPKGFNRYSVNVQGFVTGMHQFILDVTDPLKDGFLLK